MLCDILMLTHLGCACAGRRAQLYAPRLMAVMAEAAAARKQFRRGWQAVPPDAFLAWAPSMLSLLDEDVGDALLPLLEVSINACHCRRHEGLLITIATPRW